MPIVKTEILSKYKSLLRIRATSIQNKAAIDADLENNAKEIADCLAAARLFHVDLKEVDGNSSNETIQTAYDFSMTGDLPPTIRNYSMATLRKSWPRPMRAKDLMHSFEKTYSRNLHGKSIGMTLYRLANEGRVRREGWDWYYQPTPDEQNEIDEHRND